mmetsp:Transcript_41189/g.129387  ORF Transcript_41189/g.129387 Transcript_41189/m.129387 type:complete len:202 (+) Transcript_41189:1497-2102(+)
MERRRGTFMDCRSRMLYRSCSPLRAPAPMITCSLPSPSNSSSLSSIKSSSSSSSSSSEKVKESEGNGRQFAFLSPACAAIRTMSHPRLGRERGKVTRDSCAGLSHLAGESVFALRGLIPDDRKQGSSLALLALPVMHSSTAKKTSVDNHLILLMWPTSKATSCPRLSFTILVLSGRCAGTWLLIFRSLLRQLQGETEENIP